MRVQLNLTNFLLLVGLGESMSWTLASRFESKARVTASFDSGLLPEGWVVRAIANVSTEFCFCLLHRRKEISILVGCRTEVPDNWCNPSNKWTKGYYRRLVKSVERVGNTDIPSEFLPIIECWHRSDICKGNSFRLAIYISVKIGSGGLTRSLALDDVKYQRRQV